MNNNVCFPNQFFTLDKKGEIKTGIGKQSGKEWRKIDNVVIYCNGGELHVSAWGDSSTILDSAAIGTNFQGTIEINEREWNGRYFTEVQVSNITINNSIVQKDNAIPPQERQVYEDMLNATSDNSDPVDDLPF